MAIQTFTGQTAWRTAGTIPTSSGWTNVGTHLTSQDGTGYVWKASIGSTGADELAIYSNRTGLLDPRSGLPAGYTNFQITSIQYSLKVHNNLAAVAVGQHISALSVRLMYWNDQWWTTPRFSIQTATFNDTPSNTFTWSDPIVFSATNLNLSATVGSSGVTAANTFNPTNVFAGTADGQYVSPVLKITMNAASGTPVGGWYIDTTRHRVNYTYDLDVPSTARPSSAMRIILAD